MLGPLGIQRPEASSLAEQLKVGFEGDQEAVRVVGVFEKDLVARVRRRQQQLEIEDRALLVTEVGRGKYAIYVHPRFFPSVEVVLTRLAERTNIDADHLARLIRKVRFTRGLARYESLLVARDIAPRAEGRLEIEIAFGSLAGVSLVRSRTRHYVHGRSGASFLGYVNEVSSKELNSGLKEKNYRAGDFIGRAGAERFFETHLRGDDGHRAVVVDSKGRRQSNVFVGEEESEEAVPGNRLVLTIDHELQKAAEAAFDGKAGATVVMEVHTGRVLAMTSTPTFNPDMLTGRHARSERRRLHRLRALRPWRLRPTQDYFAPGSTFKVVTAIAALAESHIDEQQTVNCEGGLSVGRRRFRCWKDAGHEHVDLRASLAKSCDVYYYALGKQMGLDAIAEYARQLGFGQKTGIPLFEESAGIMPDQSWYKEKRGFYSVGAAINVSIGQGAVSVTPIQLATAYAAIANGGTVYKPQLVRRVESWEGAPVNDFAPTVVRTLDVAPGVLEAVRDGLTQVMNSEFGTAYSKRSESIRIAGKTGTAQVARLGRDRKKSREAEWRLMDHAWFAAIAPAENPEIAVVVLNEHGGSGSKAAAPIAVRIVEAWQNLRRPAELSSVRGALDVR